MTLYSEDEKRAIIMDYYLNPRLRKDKVEEAFEKNEHLHSSTCVDDIKVFYNENQTTYAFEATGCAIFLASCEIYLEHLQNIGLDQVAKLHSLYDKLINQDALSDEEKTFLGKLMIFENVKKHLNRTQCALMINNIIKNIYKF